MSGALTRAVARAVARAVESAWRADAGAASVLATVLTPLSWLYGWLVERRASGYRNGRLPIEPSALPVVVVGNLTVGGTGKTPLTAHLVDAFRARGWTPGIVSRGHGGERHERPRLVRPRDTAASVGDEPLMLRRRTGAPVCVCVHRARAVAMLATATDCDLVLSDDGLQHGAMARAAEIIVIDARQGFGNGRLLPAGPLREPPERLYRADLLAVRRTSGIGASGASVDEPGHDGADRVDARIAGTVHAEGGRPVDVTPVTGMMPLAHMPGTDALAASRLPPAFDFGVGKARVRLLPDGPWRPLDAFAGHEVHAVAGIAHPERFFATLRAHGLSIVEHPFPDHHVFRAEELRFGDERAVLVTSKDAVKFDGLDGRDALPPVYEVAIELRVAPPFDTLLNALSERLRAEKPHAR